MCFYCQLWEWWLLFIFIFLYDETDIKIAVYMQQSWTTELRLTFSVSGEWVYEWLLQLSTMSGLKKT